MDDAKTLEKMYARLQQEEATRKEFGMGGKKLLQEEADEADNGTVTVGNDFRDQLVIPGDVSVKPEKTKPIFDKRMTMPIKFTEWEEGKEITLQDFDWYGNLHDLDNQIFELIQMVNHSYNFKNQKIKVICVHGDAENGRSYFGRMLSEALCKMQPAPRGTADTLLASELSHKDITGVLREMNGGTLCIEGASMIAEPVMRLLELSLSTLQGGITLILCDRKEAMNRFLKKWPFLKKLLVHTLEIPIPTDEELTSFGEAYATDMGYTMDGVARLALNTRISMLQSYHHHVSIWEMLDIMDQAIEKNQGSLKKKLIVKINSYDPDHPALTEKDFGIK